MKFFVHSFGNSAYWELKGQKTIAKSDTFENFPEAIDNLEKTILHTLSLPIDNTDPYSLISFEIKEIENGCLWSAISTFNDETVGIKKNMRADSYDEAIKDMLQFRNTIMSSPIVDFAGVLIPNMHFNPEFAEKFNIGDIHPLFKKLNR
ncbi:hypothetical protein ID853_10975 [Xenorhabdus sp. Vera]|uniref:hypothetical protein n=1 Tax=Xenorhabdus koppenhoeferi TaxID=351659 RepID=UPI0019A78A9E|nr:hypothetical protein [Xenorhabdus sp. Vera]MBD2811390.1 hypothetical protein [Xenorhabdus sp. Vera]